MAAVEKNYNEKGSFLRKHLPDSYTINIGEEPYETYARNGIFKGKIKHEEDSTVVTYKFSSLAHCRRGIQWLPFPLQPNSDEDDRGGRLHLEA